MASTECMSGGVLLSHSLSVAVPSALKGLTSGFGMGPGVSRFAMAAVTLSTLSNPSHALHALVLACGLGLLVGNCVVDANTLDVCRGVMWCSLVRVAYMTWCPWYPTPSRCWGGCGCVVVYVVGTSPRPISTGRLGITAVHLRPINPMFCGGPYPIVGWETSS